MKLISKINSTIEFYKILVTSIRTNKKHRLLRHSLVIIEILNFVKNLILNIEFFI